jgi:hypothetical protein
MLRHPLDIAASTIPEPVTGYEVRESPTATVTPSSRTHNGGAPDMPKPTAQPDDRWGPWSGTADRAIHDQMEREAIARLTGQPNAMPPRFAWLDEVSRLLQRRAPKPEPEPEPAPKWAAPDPHQRRPRQKPDPYTVIHQDGFTSQSHSQACRARCRRGTGYDFRRCYHSPTQGCPGCRALQ